MGTSTSFGELAGKLNNVAKNIEEARRASFRQAERDMQPVFNRQARAAGGADRRPRNARGTLTAEFKVKDGTEVSMLYINPRGPWGLRDNTDVGGRTADHTILPKRASILKFDAGGETVYARRVNHPGSSRDNFWGVARDEAFTKVRQRIPEEVQRAIESALSGSGFSTRG